jgi:geranylgeranylglycerol-phosphate geranylgeranyltransferase
MAAIATIIGYFLVNLNFSFEVVLAAISVFLICGAGQAINDVYDAEIDAKVSKKKPIPSKRVSKNNAMYYSIALFIIGVLVAAGINTTAFLIALVFAFILMIYASNLYKIKYIGNVVVALGTAFTFIMGAASAGQITLLVIVFAMVAFFANMAREVTKDLEDTKKDKGFKKTLPMISKRLAKDFVILYYWLSIWFAIAALYVFQLSIGYLIIILVTIYVFIKATMKLIKGDYTKSQNNSKLGMMISLLAYIITIFR